MSLSAEEIQKIKELLKPKQVFTYKYKNCEAVIERELTIAEEAEWHKRIDALPKPSVDPLIYKSHQMTIWECEGTIATAAAAGLYGGNYDNLFSSRILKGLSVWICNANLNANVALSMTSLRDNGVEISSLYGVRGDGFSQYCYQFDAVARTVTFAWLIFSD